MAIHTSVQCSKCSKFCQLTASTAVTTQGDSVFDNLHIPVLGGVQMPLSSSSPHMNTVVITVRGIVVFNICRLQCVGHCCHQGKGP